MQFKSYKGNIDGAENATVTLNSGDHLTVGYTDPNGKFHSFLVSAQHLVFIAIHEQSDASMLIRNGASVQYIKPTKDENGRYIG